MNVSVGVCRDEEVTVILFLFWVFNNIDGIYIVLNLIHMKQFKTLTLTQMLIQTPASYKNPWIFQIAHY